jgi:hypothetical protein
MKDHYFSSQILAEMKFRYTRICNYIEIRINFPKEKTMKLFQKAIITITGLSMFGCCSWMAPSERELAQVPTVHFGEAAPAGKKFVLVYPAGTPLPIVASVGGTLMDQADKTTMHVTLKRDVYVYGHWVSFDGKKWEYGHHAVDGKFDFRLPGMENGSNPGTLGAVFNLK